jgi:outer membrane protein assembly factor BamB
MASKGAAQRLSPPKSMARTPSLERPSFLSSQERTAHSDLDELATALFGAGSSQVELPALSDLVGTLVALAEGKRRKAILPLMDSTGELAFVRQGDDVLFSYYDGGPVPQIFVRDRRLALGTLISRCARVARMLADERGQAADHAMLAVAERAVRASLKPDRRPEPSALLKRGGTQKPREGVGLAFGFTARILPGDAQASELATRADVHALLFDGELWAYAHGKRLSLVRGPIFPAVARMVNAARSVVEAWENQRALNVKLRAGEFGIAVRLGKTGEVALTLSGVAGASVTLAGLDVASALLPILRLSTELVRCVVTTDRAQSKNLRLAALRDEARALRRLVRTQSAQKSFVNRDHDLLRASHAQPSREREREPLRVSGGAEPGKLRLSLRWRAEVEGLDAGSTFLCGDRLVIATPRSQLALSRDSGELLWARTAQSATPLMAGTALVSIAADGQVELCDLADGEPYARARVAPRTAGAFCGIYAGGRGAPPVAVLSEGRDRLVAIDTRTGEPRWRFRSRGRGDFRLTRAGRILLAVSGDNTLDAIDVCTGDVAWRWSDRARLTLAPTVTRERVLAVAGSPGGPDGALLCLDLFSGQLVFRKELARAPMSSAVVSEQRAIVALSNGERAQLAAFDLTTGDEAWQCEDPGIAEGGAPLVVDHHLVVNSPLGHVTGITLDGGLQAWQHRLSDPLRDDVPRRLEPVLRGGALFVPSANVHVVRPADGALLSAPLADGIIPDFMRVDERGWLYVAEESGHIEAYAPAPSLRLIKT